MTALEHLSIGKNRLPCPECGKGPRDTALSVTITALGEGMFQCFRCGWSGRIGGQSSIPLTRTETPKPDKLPSIKKLIARSEPIRGTSAEKYLNNRSIELTALFDDQALRFVRDCFHWPTGKEYPTMVGIITNAVTNDIQAVHQTFLSHDGTKADIDKPRLYFGPKAGGVVRLAADEDVTYGLSIAEGIETAFAGLIAGYPTWACLDAGNLAAFPVLDGIEALTVLADDDLAGTTAAKQCAERWAVQEVRIAMTKRGDWNDKEQSNA
jgi:hypothetical protein